MQLSQSQIDHIRFTCGWYDFTEKQIQAIIQMCNSSFVEGVSSGILSMCKPTEIPTSTKTDKELIDSIF